MERLDSPISLLSALIGAAIAVLFFLLPAQARADVALGAYGGGGGGPFSARCPRGQLLTGFELRAGDQVDAIRPLCVTASGPRETTEPILTIGSGLRRAGTRDLGFGMSLPLWEV